MLKKLLVITLCLILCLSLFSCAEKENKTETKEENKTTVVEDPIFDTYDYSEEIELLDNIETWLGLSDTGSLKEMGSNQITIIDEKKDLDPYRQYISGLSEEDENRMLADTKGKIVLIEFTAENEYSLYSTDSIQKFGSTIAISVIRAESEEAIEAHTFFLLYFPGEIYEGESIEIVLS